VSRIGAGHVKIAKDGCEIWSFRVRLKDDSTMVESLLTVAVLGFA